MTRCVFYFVVRVVAGGSCADHAHPCCEIVHAGSSHGVLLQGRRKFRYEAGSVFVYQPGALHRVENRSAGLHTCIGVRGQFATRLPEGVWPASTVTDDLFSLCRKLDVRGGALRDRRLDRLADLIVYDLSERKPVIDLPDIDPVERIRALLDAADGPPQRLASLARLVDLSPDHLRHIFAEKVGEPPLAYQNRRRLEKARRLIATSSDSIRQIAEDCGFSDAFYFSRAFARRFGIAPTKIRATRRER